MSSSPDSSRHFTANGQPMPNYKPSAWTNACLWGEQAPNHPPFKLTDQSLIPVIVRVVHWEAKNKRSSMKTSRGLVGLMRRIQISQKEVSDIKVVRMPRSDYLKYFARDKNNNYIGSEPERNWTKQCLEEEFGMYQDLSSPLWRTVTGEGHIFLEESHEWGEKEGFRSSHVLL
ncbi:hypothetical protein BKA65DRAFT_513608 [Rhexocercosporidium sp. MPI-PUGE-AT-0058]|nr:hypothetical protein BKA65DRAFT_513608 [Rhexocercosporidium sp. MPI-PUGE-AT-0058]